MIELLFGDVIHTPLAQLTLANLAMLFLRICVIYSAGWILSIWISSALEANRKHKQALATEEWQKQRKAAGYED